MSIAACQIVHCVDSICQTRHVVYVHTVPLREGTSCWVCGCGWSVEKLGTLVCCKWPIFEQTTLNNVIIFTVH